MSAYQRQNGSLAHAVYDHIERGAFRASGLDLFGADVGVCARAIHHHLALEVAAKLRNILIVGIKYGDASRR